MGRRETGGRERQYVGWAVNVLLPPSSVRLVQVDAAAGHEVVVSVFDTMQIT